MDYQPVYAPAFPKGVTFKQMTFPKRGDLVWVIGSDREEDLECHRALVSHTIQEGPLPNWQIAFIPVDEKGLAKAIPDAPPFRVFFEWDDAKIEMIDRLREARARASAEVDRLHAKITALMFPK